MNITQTYGELLSESVTKLLRVAPISENDIFLDLGSGKGKVVTQVFTHTKVKEAHGIEINAELHAAAEHSKSLIKTNGRLLNFICGDFLTLPFTNATIVLIASPCFSPSLLHVLGDRINQIPSIHTVLSLRPIATLKRLPFKKVIRVECSWDTALCYLYQLN